MVGAARMWREADMVSTTGSTSACRGALPGERKGAPKEDLPVPET